MTFEGYLRDQNLAPPTISKHLKNIEELGTKTESQYIEYIQAECCSISVQLSLAGTASKYLKYKKKDNVNIVQLIRDINEEIQKNSQEKQKQMSSDENLPSIKDLTKRMIDLYHNEDFKGFSIMYLMLTYQVRNMDMMATIVKSKKETNDTDNFLVLNKTQVTWIRNKYKTSSTYGTKIIVIKNKKFINAVSHLSQLLSPTENIDRVIKKITGGVGEGTIAKIVLRDNNNMNSIKRVSKNRGTDVNTLLNNYNITV
jgi:hypothetical protein